MSAVEQLLKTAVAFAAMFAVDRGMKPLLLLVLLSLSYPQSSHSSVILRAFSGAETSQLTTTGSGTTGWVGNTLTLSWTSVHARPGSWLDPDAKTDFIPSDAIGIHFEISTNVRVKGVDVVVQKFRADPYGNFLSDSAHNVNGYSTLDWFASIAGPGMVQRIDDIPQTTINNVTIVDFFFAGETLAVDSQSNPSVWDALLFTSGGPEDGQSPGSIVYANVNWILRGSTGNTRSQPDNQIPAPATLALVGVGLLGVAISRRRRFRMMARTTWAAAPLLSLAFALPSTSAFAGAVSAEVPAIGNLWLAGKPVGTQVQLDRVPTNSPTEILIAPGAGGTWISFSASGLAHIGGGFPPTYGPDGEVMMTSNIASWFAGYGQSPPFVSEITSPYIGLMGVFFDSSTLQPVPTGLDFSALPGGIGFSSLAPELQQAFFVGDGLTGTGIGDVQSFLVPDGADRLFLGLLDSHDWRDNVGGFRVVISDLPDGSTVIWPLVRDPAVPEPATIALVGAALLGIAATRRSRTTSRPQP